MIRSGTRCRGAFAGQHRSLPRLTSVSVVVVPASRARRHGGVTALTRRASSTLSSPPLSSSSPSPLRLLRDPGPLGRGAQASRQTRGKKTKTTVRIEDLPQGTIALDPQPVQDDVPAYPTVVMQARRNMDKFENCVLLTRVGGFYELYFEHADEYGPLLNLKVARKKGSGVPMVLSPEAKSVTCHIPSYLGF